MINNWLSGKKIEKPQFIAFANFHEYSVVNASTMANLKLPTRHF